MPPPPGTIYRSKLKLGPAGVAPSSYPLHEESWGLALFIQFIVIFRAFYVVL